MNLFEANANFTKVHIKMIILIELIHATFKPKTMKLMIPFITPTQPKL